MSSPHSEANMIKGLADQDKRDIKDFAQQLKAVQDKAAAENATGKRTAEEEQKLKETCQEMESVFLNLMLGKMRDTIPERALFTKSSGEKMMQSMLDVELTRTMAQAGGIGLGELLYKQLTNPGVKRVPDQSIKTGEQAQQKK